MKKVLILGAGQSAPYCINYMLENAEANDWRVTLGDRDLGLVESRIKGHPMGRALAFDINNEEQKKREIADADLVINLLPAPFQATVAEACVAGGAHMISVSYEARAVRAMNDEAARKGVAILTELGLDPGIDHMSAAHTLDEIRSRGGVIKGFFSYGGGLPAMDSLSNPMKYAITWNPRNVVMAGENGAQYLIDGKIKIVPGHSVFHRSWNVDVDGLGTMEAYPNRDSLTYLDVFQLKQVDTMVRGTLRFPGWGETWYKIVQLGLPNETVRIPNLKDRTYRELVEMFIPHHVSGGDLRQRVADFLDISPTGKIMDNLIWLGLFSDEKVGVEGETMAEAMVQLVKGKLRLNPGEKDMVVLVHELEVTYPQEGDRRENVVSTLLLEGEPNGVTAMAKTVGLPAALAGKLILTGDLNIPGCHLPTHPDIYPTLLHEMEKDGIVFTERVIQL